MGVIFSNLIKILPNKKEQNDIFAKDNGKVVIDTSGGSYAWRGELELEYYLELLNNDKIDEVIESIHDKYYRENDTDKS